MERQERQEQLEQQERAEGQGTHGKLERFRCFSRQVWW